MPCVQCYVNDRGKGKDVRLMNEAKGVLTMGLVTIRMTKDLNEFNTKIGHETGLELLSTTMGVYRRLELFIQRSMKKYNMAIVDIFLNPPKISMNEDLVNIHGRTGIL